MVKQVRSNRPNLAGQIIPWALIGAFALALVACSSMSGPRITSLAPALTPPAQPDVAVVARYDPAPTMTAIVVNSYSLGYESEVASVASAECTGRTFCSVGVWTDDALAPRVLKMTDQAAAARIAQYVRNTRTGTERMLWNCAVSPHPASLCL